MAESQQQLSAELTRLRQRVAELEAECLSLKQATSGALRESEEKFRILAETTTAAIFIYQDAKNCYVNPATEAVTGYTQAELLTMNFWDIVHPDFRELVKERGLARQRGEAGPAHYEVKILTKSGQARWLDFTAGVIKFQGRPAVLGTAFDITERKQAEAEIVQRNAELLMLQYAGATIASSLDLQFVLDTFTREMANLLEAEACAISGWDQSADAIGLMAKHGPLSRPNEDSPYPLTIFPAAKQVLPKRRAHQATISQADLDPTELAYMQELNLKALLLLPILPHLFEPFFTTKPEGTGLGLWGSHNLIQQYGGIFSVKNLERDQGVAFTINLPTVSARIENDRLRLSTSLSTPGEKLSRFLHFHSLTLDRQKRLLTVTAGDQNHTLTLTEGETTILVSLMTYPDQVLSCRDLVQTGWRYDLNEREAQNIIRPHICRLRRKMSLTNADLLIYTVRKQGYVLRPVSKPPVRNPASRL